MSGRQAELGEIGYYGIYLSKQSVKKGELFSFMVLMVNMAEEVISREIKVFIQSADKADDTWVLCGSKRYNFHVGEGTHAYFTLDLSEIESGISSYPAEFLIYCGDEDPDNNPEMENAVTDIFIISER